MTAEVEVLLYYKVAMDLFRRTCSATTLFYIGQELFQFFDLDVVEPDRCAGVFALKTDFTFGGGKVSEDSTALPGLDRVSPFLGEVVCDLDFDGVGNPVSSGWNVVAGNGV